MDFKTAQKETDKCIATLLVIDNGDKPGTTISKEAAEKLLSQIIMTDTREGSVYAVTEAAVRETGLKTKYWEANAKKGLISLKHGGSGAFYEMPHILTVENKHDVISNFVPLLQNIAGITYIEAYRKNVVAKNYSGLLVLDQGDGGRDGKLLSKTSARKLWGKIQKSVVSTGDENYFIPVETVKTAGLREDYWEKAAARPPFMGKYTDAGTGECFYQMPQKFSDEAGHSFPNNFITELMQRAGVETDVAAARAPGARGRG